MPVSQPKSTHSKLVRSLGLLCLMLGSLGGSLGVSLAANSTPVLAQTPTPNPTGPVAPDQPNRPRGELWQQLNLTSEQTQRIREIRDRNQSQIQQLRANLRQTRQELGQLMDGDASQRQIQDKFAQMQVTQEQLERLQFENRLAIREVLTLEQRQQLRALIQERRQRMPGAGRRRIGPQSF